MSLIECLKKCRVSLEECGVLEEQRKDVTVIRSWNDVLESSFKLDEFS